MIPSLFFRSLRGLVVATILSSLAPGLASAQTKSTTAPAAADAQVRLDFDFPSKRTEPKGFEQTPLKTAVDFVLDQFRANGLPVNVIFKDALLENTGSNPLLDAFRVPPISLQKVTFEQAIQALAFVTKPSVTVQGDANLLVIEKVVSPTKLRVINVGEFLLREGKERRDNRLTMLRSAITKGISLSQILAPQLEIDDSSGLLFATGSAEALEIVADVARALCEPRPPAAPSAAPMAPGAPIYPPVPPSAPPREAPLPPYFGTPVPLRGTPIPQTKQ